MANGKWLNGLRCYLKRTFNHCVQSKRNVLRQSGTAQSYQGSDPHPPLSQCQDSYAAITPPFREAPLKKSCSQFGRCPSSDCVPPAPTQPGTLGHFIFELTSILTHKKACNSKRLFQLPRHDENQSKYHNRRNLGSSQAQNGL